MLGIRSSAAAKKRLCSPSLESPAPKNIETAWPLGAISMANRVARLESVAASIWTARWRKIAAGTVLVVLASAYAVARLGPLAGPAVMSLFSFISYYLFTLLSPRYRTGDPFNFKWNYTCKDAVRLNLERGFKVVIRWCVQFLNLFGVSTGYTVTTCISMKVVVALVGPDCCHIRTTTTDPYVIAFGIAQIFLSQIPDFNQQWWLSIVAAVRSFTIETAAEIQQILRSFQPDGNVTYAYSHPQTLTNILDRITSRLQNLNQPLLVNVASSTLFYMSFASFYYAFFGDAKNLFSGFGFSNPNWLEVIANLYVVFHLLGAYQAYCRPLFDFVEKAVALRFPNSRFVTEEIEVAIPGVRPFNLNLFRLVFTTVFVMVVTAVSMALPFFDAIIALLCSSGFWAMTKYFPVGMYKVQMMLPLEF